jgi:hypothetical protein
MKIQKGLLFLLFTASLLRGGKMVAQELNFDVKVVNPQVRTADPKVFRSLEVAVRDLVNTTKWTDDVFEPNERLTGSLQLTVEKENGPTSFTVSLNITAQRPIYGTDQMTPLMIHKDGTVNFNYEQFQPLQFVQNNFTDNLTASIAYYVYIILAMDYDSFSPQGGEAFWQKAQDIYNTVPEGVRGEWRGKELGNQNRYWFIENLLSPRLKNYRQGVYEYHRLGLDYATTDINQCKNMLLKALEKMEEAHQGYPNTLAVRMFSNTKGNELIEIFKAASPEQKTKFIGIMQKIDAANASRYSVVGF